MNVQQPPPYNRPAADDQDENAGRMSVLWRVILSFFIPATLAFMIAVLALAVLDRGLAQKALGIANEANGTAQQANEIATNQVSLSCTVAGYPNTVQFNQLETDVTTLQKGLANLTEDVNVLQSKVQVLETASPAASSSAVPSASGYSYESSGMKNIPESALGWILAEGVFVVVLLTGEQCLHGIAASNDERSPRNCPSPTRQ